MIQNPEHNPQYWMDKGNNQYSQKKLKEALIFYQKSFQWCQLLYGKQSIKSIVALKKIKNIFYELKQYEKAKNYSFIILRIIEKSRGIQSDDYYSQFNDIGDIFRKQNNLWQAKQYHLQYIKYMSNKYGRQHRKLSLGFFKLAYIFAKQQKYKMAMKFLKQSLKIEQEINGKIHKNCAACILEIGKLYVKTKQYQKALQLFEKSLNITQAYYHTNNHKKCIKPLQQLAKQYYHISNYIQSKKCCQRVLLISQQVYGQQNKKISTPLLYLGQCQYQLNNYSKSIDSFQRLIQILKNNDNLTFKDYHNVFRYLGNSYRSLQNHDKAIFYYSEGLKLAESQNCKNKLLNVIQFHLEITYLFYLKNQTQKARSSLEIVKNIYDSKDQLKNHYKYGQYKYIIAKAKAKKRQNKEAINLLKEAKILFQNHFGLKCRKTVYLKILKSLQKLQSSQE